MRDRSVDDWTSDALPEGGETVTDGGFAVD